MILKPIAIYPSLPYCACRPAHTSAPTSLVIVSWTIWVSYSVGPQLPALAELKALDFSPSCWPMFSAVVYWHQDLSSVLCHTRERSSKAFLEDLSLVFQAEALMVLSCFSELYFIMISREYILTFKLQIARWRPSGRLSFWVMEGQIKLSRVPGQHVRNVTEIHNIREIGPLPGEQR